MKIQTFREDVNTDICSVHTRAKPILWPSSDFIYLVVHLSLYLDAI
jgi:hypothetical protein